MVSETTRLSIVLVLTFLFMLLELVVGILANSLVLLSDSMHMLSDVLSLIIALVSGKLATAPRTERATYGLVRMHIFGAFINSVFLFAICWFIFLEALQKIVFFVPTQLKSHADELLIVGGIGVVSNVIGLLVTTCRSEGSDKHGHSHESHGHSHSSLNLQGVILHVMGDVVGSVIVIVSGLVLKYSTWSDSELIDPLLSIVLAIIIATSAAMLFRKTIRFVLQKAPKGFKLNELRAQVSKLDGIRNVHELHVWQLTTEIAVGSVHVSIDEHFPDVMQLLDEIKKIFHEFGIHATTIQPEICSEDEMIVINICNPPFYLLYNPIGNDPICEHISCPSCCD